MLPADDVAVTTSAPLVAVRPGVIGEGDAARVFVTRVSTGQVYRVLFRLRGGAAVAGCVASATMRVRSGSPPRLRVALVPRSLWCSGVGVLSVGAGQPGAAVGTTRLRVRPAQALGRGDVVGRLLLGPTCPVARADDPCDPVARPAPVKLVALDASGAETERTVTLGDGSFALDLAVGTYTLHAERTAAAYPTIADTRVVVTAQATRSQPKRVTVTGDTGIR